jgi:hypothetical protein
MVWAGVYRLHGRVGCFLLMDVSCSVRFAFFDAGQQAAAVGFPSGNDHPVCLLFVIGKENRPNGDGTAGTARDGPSATGDEQSLRGNQNRKLSQKRVLALTHDRRFNRLRNVPSGIVTRAFSALYGNVYSTQEGGSGQKRAIQRLLRVAPQRSVVRAHWGSQSLFNSMDNRDVTQEVGLIHDAVIVGAPNLRFKEPPGSIGTTYP